MANEVVWMVRANEKGGYYYYDKFKEHGLVGINFMSDIGDLDLSNMSTKEIKEKANKPDSKSIATSIGQANSFSSKMKKGDKVVTHDTKNQMYLIGEIIGNYEYISESSELSELLRGGSKRIHMRRVKWVKEISKNKIGTIIGQLTVFKIRILKDEILKAYYKEG